MIKIENLDDCACYLAPSVEPVCSADLVIIPKRDGVPYSSAHVSRLAFPSFDVTKGALVISWEPCVGVYGYVVQYSSDDGKTWRLAGYCPHWKTSFNFHAFSSQYLTFRVAAFNERGQSDWIAAPWNYADWLKPAAPLLSAPVLSGDNLELSWVKPEDSSVVGYFCEYSFDQDVWRSSGFLNVDCNFRIVRVADAETPIYFRVCTKNADNVCSDWVYTAWAGSTSGNVGTAAENESL